MSKFKPAYARTALFIGIALFLSACGHYPSINVTVVDAETSEPIEGAVLISHWTMTSGFGYTSTHDFKIVEAVSNKSGTIKLDGVSKVGINPPSVSIYKRGYVAWNNERIFPSYEKRENFSWRDNYVFRMEKFKKEHSISKHVRFMKFQDHSSTSGIYRQAWRWEALAK